MFGIPGDGPFDDLEGVLSLNGTGTVELNGAAVTPGAVPLQGLNDLLVRPQGTLNVSVTIDDGESPEVFASFSPPANRFGWNNETIELAPFCIDALSGVKECPEPAEWENQGLLDKLSIADLINNSVGDQIGAADRVDNRPDTTTAVTLVDGTPIRFKLDRAAPQVLAGDTGGGLVDVPRVRIDWQIRDNCSGVRGLAVNGIENSLASTEDADGAIFALTGELQGRAGALGSYTCDGTQTKRVHQGSSIDTAISQSWGLDCESEVGGETFRFQTDLSCSLDLDLCNAVDGERISLAAELTDFANNRAEEFVGLTLFRPRLGPGCLALLGNRYARTGQGGAFTIPNVVQGSWPQRVRLLCGREEEARNQGQSAAAPIEPAVGLRTEVQEIRFCPFEPAIAELAVGVAGTVEFGATTPLDLAAVPQGTAFTTSNPAVAVIEGSQVRAVSLGRALVVARYEGLVATAEITVVPATGGGDGGGDDGGGDDGGGDDGGGGDGGGGGRPGPRPPVEPPVEPLVARPGSDATLPLDGSLTLGEDPPAAGGTPPYSFFWSLSRSRAGLLSSTTDANPVLTVTERGLLAVNLVVRDSAGAVALGQLEVNIVCPTLKQLDERLVGARIELLRSSTAGDGSQAEIAGEILKILQRIEECTSPAASGGAPR